MSATIPCPKCSSRNLHTGGIAYCKRCRMQYDDEPVPEYSGTNPLRNLINREEYEQREKQRRRECERKRRFR